MPPKSRDLFTVERSARDFGWFSSGSSAATQPVPEYSATPPSARHLKPPANKRRPPSRHRTGPKSRSSSVPRSTTASRRPSSVRASPSIFSLPNRPRQDKMMSIVEESTGPLMTPAIVVEPPPAEPEERKAGPWSGWYETRDQKRYWRARKLSDETWDYQYSDTNPSVPPKVGKPAKPSTGGRGLAFFFFGIPASPPGGSSGSNMRPRPATLFPPPPPREDECASTNSDSTGLPTRSRLRVPAARSSGTTFPSSVSTGKGKGSSLSIPSSEKVSTLSRLDEDGRPAPKPVRTEAKTKQQQAAANNNNNKSKAKPKPKTKSAASKPARSPGMALVLLKPPRVAAGPTPAQGAAAVAAATATATGTVPNQDMGGEGDHPDGIEAGGYGYGYGVGNPNAAANGKKLHSKVKNEKELRIDTKRRVKRWLADIGPEAPEPPGWDAEGLPIYK